MSALKHILAPALIAVSAFPSQARWFEVEVLLFARNQDPTQLEEDFSQSRLTPMTIRKQALLESVLLAPSDCPKPEQEIAHETLYDEFGFPITAAAEPETLKFEAKPAPPITTETQTSQEPTVADIESGVALDEFGFPIEETGRSPEEQAAYDQWLLDCEKPQQLNEYDLLPVTVAATLEPLTDEAPYLLTQAQLQLGEALQKLISNPNYQPMLHTGWRMDIQSKRQMPAIRLVAGNNFGQSFNDDGWEHLKPLDESLESAVDETELTATTDELSESLLEPLAAEPAEQEPNLYDTDALLKALLLEGSEEEKEPRHEAVWEMQTDLRIWLASWLHMEAQSTLRRLGRKAPPQLTELSDTLPTHGSEQETMGTLMANDATAPYLYSYHLDQFRRVRSEEIHYFDHPLMGIIIQIRPYTPREPLEAPEE